jgi:hypothetical protein
MFYNLGQLIKKLSDLRDSDLMNMIPFLYVDVVKSRLNIQFINFFKFLIDKKQFDQYYSRCQKIKN